MLRIPALHIHPPMGEGAPSGHLGLELELEIVLFHPSEPAKNVIAQVAL